MEENYDLAKWLNDELTDAELKKFEASDDYDLYLKIKEQSKFLKTSDFDNQEQMLNNILATEKQTKKVVPLYGKWFFKVAAILVIGLCVSYFLKNSYIQTINVGNDAEMVEVSLPDNSKVLLNDGSNLSYSTWNWDNNRILHLKGEAYFKVAKGKKFDVNTNLGKVSVLGTQFNVKDRNNRFDVTCYEGKVKVNYNDDEVIITKGQTVSFENNKKIIERKITENNPSWLADEITFEKETLYNIIAEIQRQNNIKIEVKTNDYVQLFTGKIPQKNIDIALQIIASNYHLQIIKTNENTYSLEDSK